MVLELPQVSLKNAVVVAVERGLDVLSWHTSSQREFSLRLVLENTKIRFSLWIFR